MLLWVASETVCGCMRCGPLAETHLQQDQCVWYGTSMPGAVQQLLQLKGLLEGHQLGPKVQYPKQSAARRHHIVCLLLVEIIA